MTGQIVSMADAVSVLGAFPADRAFPAHDFLQSTLKSKTWQFNIWMCGQQVNFLDFNPDGTAWPRI